MAKKKTKENVPIRYYSSPKREKYIKNLLQYLLTGEGNLADIYLEAGFKAKNRAIARSNSWRLKNHPLVKKEVESLKDYLKKYMPSEAVALKLAQLGFTAEPRAALEAIKQRNQLLNEYPDKRIQLGVYKAREEVFE